MGAGRGTARGARAVPDGAIGPSSRRVSALSSFVAWVHRVGNPVLPLTVSLGTAAVLITALLPAGETPLVAWLLLVAAVVVAELRPVTVGRRTQHQNFTLIEGPVVVAIALSPGSLVVLAVAMGIVLAQLHRRIVLYKLAYNLAQFSTATACAALCATVVPGSGGVVLGIAVFTFLNELLIRLVLWIATGARFGYVWQEGDVVRLLHVAAATSVGLLAATTWQHDPYLLPAFLGPIALVQWSQEQTNRRQVQGSIAQALAQQATSLYGRSSHESALLILRSARELVTCAEAEIILLGPDGALSMRDGGNRSQPDERRLDPQDLLQGWSGEVLDGVRAVSHERWAGVVIGRTEPIALLGVWRGADQDVFREMDCHLLQQLADDVRHWLAADTGVSGAVDSARLRAAEVGGSYEQVADALGCIVRVRQALLSGPVLGEEEALRLAEELRLAADEVAEFVSDLVSVPEQATGEDVVHTGRWTARAW